eukprot:TRINITY_DN8762_c0_g1_i1.p1 TRINITY_DN8762_c0_g1~~TRINITY_DN8762_c0_g1_i1.p1  ORF type:complete len:226 (+),score=86.93 TRINITY_DN8762_c0_g1_i1:57-680(+)
MSFPLEFFNIETPRLILRSPIIEDDEQLQAILSDLTTMKYLRFLTNEPNGWTIEQIQNRRKNFLNLQSQKKALYVHVIEKETNKLIGSSGFTFIDMNHLNGKFGIVIDHRYWKFGFCSEIHYYLLKHAFEQLNLHRISFETFELNRPMQSFFEKFSIQFEAIRKDCLRDPDLTWRTGYDYVLFDFQWSQTKQLLKQHLEQKFNLLIN